MPSYVRTLLRKVPNYEKVATMELSFASQKIQVRSHVSCSGSFGVTKYHAAAFG